jgi:serine/threonine protein kinase
MDPYTQAAPSLKRGALAGTPIYMSPEQKQASENVSYPSDIYSLGIIAYELILGRLSHSQVHLSLMPKGLQKILATALQPMPKDRYLDIVDFITAISSYLHSPQFEKEKKTADQSGELFEKLQILQNSCITLEKKQLPGIELGYILHRPLNFSSIYADLQNEPPLIIFAESLNTGVDSVWQIIYFKGLLDALMLEKLPLELLADKLNKLLLNAFIPTSIALGLLTWDTKSLQVQFLSCGFGPLWKISAAGDIEKLDVVNIALGVSEGLPFQINNFKLLPNTQICLCPLSAKEPPTTLEYFELNLKENYFLPPQKMAETLYRKTTASHIRYFEDHPFTLAVIKFM